VRVGVGATGDAGAVGVSLSCPVPEAALVASYALLAAAAAARAALSIAVIAALSRKRSVVRALRESPLLRLVAFDGLVIQPVTLAFPAVKLAPGGLDRVVGTDVAVTVLFGLSIWLGLFASCALASLQLSTLVLGSVQHTQRRRALLQAFQRRTALSLALYAVPTLVIPLGLLGAPKSLGPFASGEAYLVPVRNALIMLTYAARVRDFSSAAREAQAVADAERSNVVAAQANANGGVTPAPLTTSSSEGSRGGAPGPTPLVAVIDFLGQSMRETRSTGVFIVVVYGLVGSLPWFWAYQPIIVCCAFALANIRTNTALSVVRVRRAARLAARRARGDVAGRGASFVTSRPSVVVLSNAATDAGAGGGVLQPAPEE